MRKIIYALIILVIANSAFSTFNITMTSGTGIDCNKVTVAYQCTAGEEVRAFALRIAVTNKKFAVGSPQSLSIDYYICPGSIQFAVAGDGETYINNLGTPVAGQDPNGGVIEMASLYAAGDVNHPSAPPSAGNLLRFRVNAQNGTPQTVTLSLDTQRGGVVLKDPNVTPTIALPAALTVCGPCPLCWLCLTQPYGDATGVAAGSPPDGKVNVYDLSAVRKAYGTNSTSYPHGKALGQYNCCADFCGMASGSGPDGKVNIYDLARLRKNYGKTLGSGCPDACCL